MTKWEYLREIIDTPRVTSQLDPEWQMMGERGEEGWELTAAVRLEKKLYFYFKRPVSK